MTEQNRVYETMTAHERTMRAKLAAHTRWSREPDRLKATEPARKAAMARFERDVDPEGKLTPATRAKLAENARKAYFQRLALLSAQARKRR